MSFVSQYKYDPRIFNPRPSLTATQSLNGNMISSAGIPRQAILLSNENGYIQAKFMLAEKDYIKSVESQRKAIRENTSDSFLSKLFSMRYESEIERIIKIIQDLKQSIESSTPIDRKIQIDNNLRKILRDIDVEQGEEFWKQIKLLSDEEKLIVIDLFDEAMSSEEIRFIYTNDKPKFMELLIDETKKRIKDYKEDQEKKKIKNEEEDS